MSRKSIETGKKNLVPLNQRPEKEKKAITSKGGKATAKKKKEQKTYKELTEAILKKQVKDAGLLEEAEQFGIKNPNVKAITLIGMIKAAANGSPNAFDRLMELTGEKTKDENADVIEKLDSIIEGVDKLAD